MESDTPVDQHALVLVAGRTPQASVGGDDVQDRMRASTGTTLGPGGYVIFWRCRQSTGYSVDLALDDP